jgi:hypothetical protein
MRLSCLFVPIALLVPAAAHAGACEDSFTKGGSILSGQKFAASVTLPGLKPASAIGQMRGIVVAKGYDVLAAEPEEGSMLIEQAQTRKARAFPITVTATPDGKVLMEAKLRAGMSAPSEAAKEEMCGMLAQLKTGKAGTAAASTGMTAAGNKTALDMDALSISHQISKDTQRNAAAIPLRYKGKTFIVSGTVKSIDKLDDAYVVTYDIPEPYNEAIRLPGAAPFKTDIFCRLAKGQSVFALQLKPGKRIKLSGIYANFNPTAHGLLLEDCRPVK